MNVHVASAKIKPEGFQDVQAGAKKLFAAIEAAQPEGIRYAWLLLPDDETFAALVQVDDGVENPIPDLPEYRELQDGLQSWLAGPPERRSATVVASYRLF
jgi:hypothetical protein